MNGTAAKPAAVPNVASLDIGEAEIRMIDQLSPLLGRSPRAIKRFVNVYRLVKAGLTSHELRVFMRQDEQGLGEFQVALFLLAIDTGLPKIARTLFDVLKNHREPETPSREHDAQGAPNTMDWLMERLGDAVDRESPEWISLISWLEVRRQEYGSANVLRWLVDRAPLIARYSFQPPESQQRWALATVARTRSADRTSSLDASSVGKRDDTWLPEDRLPTQPTFADDDS